MTSDSVAVTSAAAPEPSWIALRAEPASVTIARRFARDAVTGRACDASTVALVVSELVTNGLRAAARVQATGRPVRLGVAVCDRWAYLRVTDPDLDPPVPRAAGPDDETGRGLAIVAGLSAIPWWTTYGDGGKTVHAVIAAPGVTLTSDELMLFRGVR